MTGWGPDMGQRHDISGPQHRRLWTHTQQFVMVVRGISGKRPFLSCGVVRGPQHQQPKNNFLLAGVRRLKNPFTHEYSSLYERRVVLFTPAVDGDWRANRISLGRSPSFLQLWVCIAAIPS